MATNRAAAFGRLCVETHPRVLSLMVIAAAAFGRLCVETLLGAMMAKSRVCSRLRAAVC